MGLPFYCKHQTSKKKRFKETPQKMQVPNPNSTSRATEPAKNVAIFKPWTLLHDTTINEFCQGQKHFQAYYKQSNMEDDDPNLQRSFLNTCIDDPLADIIGREAAHKQPRLYSDGPTASLMKIREKYFDNLHPLLIRLNKLATLYPTTNPGWLLRRIHATGQRGRHLQNHR